MSINIDEILENKTQDGIDGRLEHRLNSIRKVAELFSQKNPKVLVETGCQSNNLLHAHGLSTSIFGHFAKLYNGILHTVDINPSNINICREYTKDYEEYIRYYAIDSVKYLNNFYQKIDFLYLDSYDFYEGCEEESRNHQLKEIEAAWKNLSKGSIILLDDAKPQMWFIKHLNEIDSEGKSYYAHRFLLEHNAECLIDEYQRLYVVR